MSMQLHYMHCIALCARACGPAEHCCARSTVLAWRCKGREQRSVSGPVRVAAREQMLPFWGYMPCTATLQRGQLGRQ